MPLCMILSALPGSLIDSVEAMALPPSFLISLTTSCAGPSSCPAPSRVAPISQTTTLRAFFRHQKRDAAADAARRAGDDGDFARNDARHQLILPTLRARSRRSFAVSPTAHPRSAYCPPRSRRSRIAATAANCSRKAGISMPPRSVASAHPCFSSSPVLLVMIPSPAPFSSCRAEQSVTARSRRPARCRIP